MRPRTPRRLSTPLLIAALTSATAAVAAININIVPTVPFELNATLRGDLRPVTDGDRAFQPTYKSPFDAVQVVAPMSPALPDDQLMLMRKSRCYWPAAAEKLRLNWEAIVPLTEDGIIRSPFPLGMCSNTAADTRAPLIIDGDEYTVGPIRLVNGSASLVVSGASPRANAFDECSEDLPGFDNRDASLLTAANPGGLCAPSGLNYPLCAVGCDFLPTARDADYQLYVRTGATVALHAAFDPIIKPVVTPRTLSRPLCARGTAGCTPLSSGRGDLCDSAADGCYAWSTPELGDLTWDENFSPDVIVTQVRFFVPISGDGAQKHYVAPQSLYLRSGGAPLAARECQRSPSDTGFRANELCPPLVNGVSPTQFRNNLGQRITWEATFDESQLPIDIPGTNLQIPKGRTPSAGKVAAPIRVEFLVASTTAPPTLRATPSRVSATYDHRSPGASFPQVVSIENTGATRIDVLSVGLSGADAARLAVRAQASLPAALMPANRLTLELTMPAPPSGPSHLTAVVEIEYRANGTHRTLQVPVSLDGELPIAQVVPSLLTLKAYFDCGVLDATHPSAQLARRFVLVNAGRLPLAIRGITPSGPNAGAFRVAPGAPAAVAAGGSFTGLIDYVPAGAGAHAASLDITTDIGVASLSLSGTTFSGCRTAQIATPRTLQFGVQPVGTPATRGVTVTNAGDARLDVSRIVAVGANASAYAVAPGTLSLLPGASATVNVTFTPARDGDHAAELSLSSNDPVTPDRRIALSGFGASPLIDAAPASVMLSSATAVRDVTVMNLGGVSATLRAANLTVSAPFRVTLVNGAALPATTTLAPTQALVVRVSVASGTRPGAYLGRLQWVTDGPAPSSATVALSATF